jgi:Arc/MetJ family transcription regulator
VSLDDAARFGVEVVERKERIDRTRVEMMRGYGETRDCRRQFLLSYFGETLAGLCGNCDRCDEASDGNSEPTTTGGGPSRMTASPCSSTITATAPWWWMRSSSRGLAQALGVLQVYHLCMRTNIDLDDELVAEVMRRYGVTTKKEAVDLALRRLVGVPLSRDFLLGLEGVGWEGSLEDIRREQPTELQ